MAVTYNQPGRFSHDELIETATAAIIREYTAWGVSETEARAAVERNFVREQRLGPELAAEWAWPDDQPIPTQRQPDTVDLRDRADARPR